MEDDIDKLLRNIKVFVIKYKTIVIIIVIFICIIGIYKYIKNDQDIINISKVYTDEKVDDNKSDIEQKNKIVVHIDGEVKNKGVYTIDSESRLNDLVNLAGGLTELADISKINLAKKISDGEKIYIYAIGEEISIKKEDEINIYNDGNSKININTANKEELKKLPGVGDSTADKIINYRNKNGFFEQIEDIQNVSGIGESKFENIEELICI